MLISVVARELGRVSLAFCLALVLAGTVTISVGEVAFLQASWTARQHAFLPLLVFSCSPPPEMMDFPQGPQDAFELPFSLKMKAFVS